MTTPVFNDYSVFTEIRSSNQRVTSHGPGIILDTSISLYVPSTINGYSGQDNYVHSDAQILLRPAYNDHAYQTTMSSIQTLLITKGPPTAIATTSVSSSVVGPSNSSAQAVTRASSISLSASTASEVSAPSARGKVGIGIGTILGAICFVLFVWALRRKAKKRKHKTAGFGKAKTSRETRSSPNVRCEVEDGQTNREMAADERCEIENSENPLEIGVGVQRQELPPIEHSRELE